MIAVGAGRRYQAPGMDEMPDMSTERLGRGRTAITAMAAPACAAASSRAGGRRGVTPASIGDVVRCASRRQDAGADPAPASRPWSSAPSPYQSSSAPPIGMPGGICGIRRCSASAAVSASRSPSRRPRPRAHSDCAPPPPVRRARPASRCEPVRQGQRDGRRQRRVALHPGEREDDRGADPALQRLVAGTSTRVARSISRSKMSAGVERSPSAWRWISSRLSRSGTSRLVRVTCAATSRGDERIEDRAAGGAEDLDRLLPVRIARPAGREIGQQAPAAPSSASGSSVANRASSARRCAASGDDGRRARGRRRSARRRNRRRRSAWPPPRSGSGGAARSARTCAADWRPARPDRARPGRSAATAARAHLHHPVELGDRIGAVVPQAADGLGGRGRPGLAVADIAQPFGERRRASAAAPSASVCGAVEPVDREPVPAADADAISVGEVRRAVDQRRCAAPDSPSPNSGPAMQAAKLWARPSAWPTSCAASWRMRGERDPDRIVGPAAVGLAGADQAFEDQHVLAHAQRAEQHLAADDLAGARILDHLAVGPAAGGAVDPADRHCSATSSGSMPSGSNSTRKASI